MRGALAALVLFAAACSSSVTKDEFVDHALKISTAAKTAEDRARLQAVFECTWGDVQKDQELLDSFMSSDKPSPELSTQMSKLMVPCLSKGAPAPATTTTVATTTVPSG